VGTLWHDEIFRVDVKDGKPGAVPKSASDSFTSQYVRIPAVPIQARPVKEYGPRSCRPFLRTREVRFRDGLSGVHGDRGVLHRHLHVLRIEQRHRQIVQCGAGSLLPPLLPKA
jgi:hypothetical protein